jgi:DNA-directed RNA polymerase subunit E'/Rpb7
MTDTNKYQLMSTKSQLTRKVQIPMKYLGDNIISLIKNKLTYVIEGKCAVEGYVVNESINVINYSSGTISGSNVEFQVVFECNIVCPVEGVLISCVVENITKAGIKAKIFGDVSPLVIFVARDHNINESMFNNINENETIVVKVLGQRYELNDKYISVIAELTDKTTEPIKKEKKPRTLKTQRKTKIKLKE